MKKKGFLIATLAIGIGIQTGCSTQNAEAEPTLEVAGVEWVEQELDTTTDSIESMEASTRKMEQDIKEIEAALEGKEVEPVFKDVGKDYWAFTEVMYMYNHQYIQGYPEEQRFKPENYLTRAQAASMLVKVLDLPLSDSPSPFKDIGEDFWAKKQIVTVAEHGLFNGSDGNFMPNGPMKRKHMAVVLQRAFGLQPTSDSYSGYVDVPESDDGYAYIKIVSQNGIAQGNQNNEFMPYEPTKRSQFSVFLYRAINKGLLK